MNTYEVGIDQSRWLVKVLPVLQKSIHIDLTIRDSIRVGRHFLRQNNLNKPLYRERKVLSGNRE